MYRGRIAWAILSSWHWNSSGSSHNTGSEQIPKDYFECIEKTWTAHHENSQENLKIWETRYSILQETREGWYEEPFSNSSITKKQHY